MDETEHTIQSKQDTNLSNKDRESSRSVVKTKKSRRTLKIVILSLFALTIVLAVGYFGYRFYQQKPSSSQDVPAQKNIDFSKQKYNDTNLEKASDEVQKREAPPAGGGASELPKR